MFASSILDLEPDTSRSHAWSLSRYDGAKAHDRTVAVRDPDLMPAAGGVVICSRLAGHEAEPSFRGLMCAYQP